jgi:hypothetical protein
MVRKRNALVIRMRVRSEGAVARKVGNTLSASDTAVQSPPACQDSGSRFSFLHKPQSPLACAAHNDM